MFKALEVCDDNLSLALNLAFSCSLHMGEMLGLTWDCIDISEKSIKNDCAYIFVNKELQRVNCNALEQLGEKGVMFKFPPTVASTHTALVLKESKTKTSIRKIFLPKTVAEMLVKRQDLKEYHKNDIAKYKKIYENNFSYLKVLSEINYTKNNQRLMILTIIISIAAIFISVLTA